MSSLYIAYDTDVGRLQIACAILRLLSRNSHFCDACTRLGLHDRCLKIFVGTIKQALGVDRKCFDLQTKGGGSTTMLRGRVGHTTMHNPQPMQPRASMYTRPRSEEHTSELQSRGHLVCRLLLEK